MPSIDQMTGDQNVRVHVLGGTIVCGDWVGDELFDEAKHGPRETCDAIKANPVSGKAQAMLQDFSSEVWKHVGNIRLTEADKLRDSAEYDPAMLMRMIKEMRRVVADLTPEEAGVVFTFGTDTGAFLAHAAVEGIPQKILGNKSLIIATSQHYAVPNRPEGHRGPFYPAGTEAVENFESAVYLATREEMRGRIGLCCGDSLHGPRGLHKINAIDRHPFVSKYPNIAENSKSGALEHRWHFNVENRRDFQPRERNNEFILSLGGVEDMSLTPTSNYENLVSAMAGMTNPEGAMKSLSLPRRLYSWLRGVKLGRAQKDFCGLVVQAPGLSNLRKSNADLQKINAAAEIGAFAGAPLVIISDPLQTFVGVESGITRYGTSLSGMRRRLDQLSFGAESHVIDGGSLTRTEATMLMSQAVAEASRDGLKGKAVVQYVADFIDRYWHWLENGTEMQEESPAKA